VADSSEARLCDPAPGLSTRSPTHQRGIRRQERSQGSLSVCDRHLPVQIPARRSYLLPPPPGVSTPRLEHPAANERRWFSRPSETASLLPPPPLPPQAPLASPTRPFGAIDALKRPANRRDSGALLPEPRKSRNVADFIGDSLELSDRGVSATDAEVNRPLCVSPFHARNAKNPLAPLKMCCCRSGAGCPMPDACPATPSSAFRGRHPRPLGDYIKRRRRESPVAT